MSNKLMICVVFDKAVECYMQPIFVRHVGEAIRGFTDEVNSKDSPMNRHPSDYVLYLIGTYDAASGWITPEQPTSLITALQCLPTSTD